MEIIEITNLAKNYHTDKGEIAAIKDVSLSIKEGEFIAIVGSSGCGKSTILSILAGLEKPTSGTIKIKENSKIGYMLQQDCLFNWLNIYKNCILGLEITNSLSQENINHVLSLIKNYGLKEFVNHYPYNLSGGMRQRVALIRTLAINPDLLLMDEPFSALDYQTRLAVSDDVYKIIRQENKTAIMVTHDIAEAISMADRVIVLSKRPCTVKNIIDIKISNKSTPIENRKAKEFSYYYDLIWKAIDFHE